MVNVLKSKNKLCTGCGGCYNVCPVNAIYMYPDKYGFLYPSIDKERCIGCKKCEMVCPKLHPDFSNEIDPKCYAVSADDNIRLVSSSGGVFTVLAKWVFRQRGSVCGAAFDENFRVHHICIDKEKELEKLQKSKYVQSDIEKVFQQIISILEQDKWVLFVGTPCQVAGLKNYVAPSGKKDKLILVDFLCGGNPSPQMWKDYLGENFDVSSIKKIDFRPKEGGWKNSATTLSVSLKNGMATTLFINDSEYEQGYHKYLTKRSSCTICEFCGYQRQGDLTIGDFWGIDRYDPTLNDGKGLSVVLVNNKKGKEVFEAVKGGFAKVTQTPLSAMKFNSIITMRKAHPMKERFHTLYPQKSFSEAVRQCINKEHDVVVLGNVTGMNYGSHLTHYALYTALTDMGYSATVLNVPTDALIKANDFPELFAVNPYPEWDWCKRYGSKIEMKELNYKCKAFITGSDQQFASWLYNNDGQFVTQPFVSGNRRKIAYAASLGHNKVNSPEKERATMSYFLKKFDAISVREDTAIALFEREFGVKSTHVLDPVFLMSMEKYKELISRAPDTTPKEPYLFTYLLDPNREKEKAIREYAKKHKLQICAISDGGGAVEWDIPTLTGSKLETWLACFADSKFIITDSFHGMCMAIIFRKQFIAIVNKRRGATRFESLLRLLKLEEYSVYSEAEMESLLSEWKNIDFDMVDSIIDQERIKSKKWLIEAIEGGSNKKSIDTFDILDMRIDEMENNFNDRLENVMHSIIYPLVNLYLTEKFEITNLTDIHTYLLVLMKYRYRFIIFISVKDTPGYELNEAVADGLIRLGISTNLVNCHWHSYLGVISQGRVLLDKLGDIGQNLEETLDVLGLSTHLVSKCYRTGNLSEIIIHGVNYSINHRGLNFVIWDVAENKVIDSVCFDTHLKERPCFRIRQK